MSEILDTGSHDGETGQSEDDRGPMTFEERSVVAYLVAVVLTSGTYFAVMVPRAIDGPVEEISWVRPMAWTIGASLALTVVGNVVLTGVTETIRARRGQGSDNCGHADERDVEIGHVGARASMAVIGAGYLGAMVLAMADADTFWIGNALFLFGTIGAIVETVVKIRLYRRGF